MTESAGELDTRGNLATIFERLRAQQQFAKWALLPTVTAIVLAASQYGPYVTYYDFANGPTFYQQHTVVREDSKWLNGDVYSFRDQQKAPPKTLSATGLKLYRAERPHAKFNEQGEPLDPWGRPYQYQVRELDQDSSYWEIWSLGRDGQPGGHGLDADYGQTSVKVVYPTLGEFYSDRTDIDPEVLQRVQIYSLLSMCVVLVAFVIAIRRRLLGPNPILTPGWLAVTTIGIAALPILLPLGLFAVFFIFLFFAILFGFFWLILATIWIYCFGNHADLPEWPTH